MSGTYIWLDLCTTLNFVANFLLAEKGITQFNRKINIAITLTCRISRFFLKVKMLICSTILIPVTTYGVYIVQCSHNP